MGKSIPEKIVKYSKYSPLPFVALMLLYKEPNIWSLIAGFFVIFSGESLRLWGAGYSNYSRGESNTAPLVIAGPFAYVRYPLYLGNILLYFGIVLMSGALFPFFPLATLIFFYFQYSLIINEELASNRADSNHQNNNEYLTSVRALIPGLSAFKSSNFAASDSFNLKTAFNRESGNIRAFSFLTVTLIIIWLIGRY